MYKLRSLPPNLDGDPISQAKAVAERMLLHMGVLKYFYRSVLRLHETKENIPYNSGRSHSAFCKSNADVRVADVMITDDLNILHWSDSHLQHAKSNSHQFRARERPLLRLWSEADDPGMVLSNARGMLVTAATPVVLLMLSVLSVSGYISLLLNLHCSSLVSLTLDS